MISDASKDLWLALDNQNYGLGEALIPSEEAQGGHKNGKAVRNIGC